MMSTDSRFERKIRSEVAFSWCLDRTRILLAMILIIGLVVPVVVAEAQEQEGSIDFPLELDVDASGNLRWILLPLANEAQVHVEDSVARNILFRVANDLLTSIISSEAQKKRRFSFNKVFDAFSSSLSDRVAEENLELSFGKVFTEPYMAVKEGLESGAKDTLTAPIKFLIKGTPLKSLLLVLTIGARADRYDSMTVGTLGELATTHGLDQIRLTEAAAKTVVSVRNFINLTASEINLLRPQLARIAVDVFNHAKAKDLAFGKPPPQFGKRDNELDKRFKFPGTLNVTLFMEKSSNQSFSHKLTISFLKVVREIVIEHPNKDFLEQANKLVKDIRNSLPQVWNAEFDMELMARLFDDRRVVSHGIRQIKDGVYTIKPELGGPLFQGNAKATVGLTYSTEKHLAGIASVTVMNISGRNEQTSIEAEFGDEIREAKLGFSLPYPPYRSFNSRLMTSNFFLNAAYTRDKDQLYETVKADQEVLNMGVGYKLVWDQLNSKQRAEWGLTTVSDRKRTHFVTNGKLTFDYEDWHFLSQDPSAPSLNDGQYGIVELGIAEDITFDLRQGQSTLREFEIPVRVAGQYGLDINDDNNDYTQLEFAVKNRLYIGWQHDKDVFFSAEYRGGISDNGTPIFKKFKIGSDDTVRGLESGEILANTYSFQTLEMGVSLRTLLCPILSCNDQNGDSPQPPIIQQLSNVYLEIFYDRGAVSTDASFSELFQFESELEGYGIDFNIKIPFKGTTAELEMGYARSPDSVEHSSGLFFTRLVAAKW